MTMKRLDDGSDMEDSQATQLIHDMLDTGDVSWKPSGSPHEDISIPKDIPDSSPSRTSNSNSTSHYHYHGLAATQTQIIDDDPDPKEGSQKENIKANKIRGPGSREVSSIPPITPHPASSKKAHINLPLADQPTHSLSHVIKVTKNKVSTAQISTHSPPLKPATMNNKAVSFQSPQKAPSGSKNTASARYTPPKRSTTYPSTPTFLRAGYDDSSQDSFAGAPYQDPEQKFLATSKQFDIPLSELQHIVSPPGRTQSTDSMYSHSNSTRRIRRSLSPPKGLVLVESTPSASGGSQSQPSQPLEDYQEESMMSGRQPDYMDLDMAADLTGTLSGTEGYVSDAPSSSYARHLEPDYVEPPPAPVVFEDATQPSTQLEEEYELNPTSNHHPEYAETTAQGTSCVRGAANTANILHARNLLSLIDPKKMWRYQKYHQDLEPSALQGPTPSPVVATAGSSTAVVTEETQPSLEDETAIAPLGQFPTRPRSSRRPQNNNTPPGRRMQVDDDRMDVVPDSEPLRDDDGIVASAKATSRSPAKRLNRTAPSNDPSTEDIVPDSMSIDVDDSKSRGQLSLERLGKSLFPDEEEEEDVPLAVTVANPNKRSTIEKGKAREVLNNPAKGKGLQSRKGKAAELRKRNTKQSHSVDQSALPIADVPKDVRETRAAASLPIKKAAALGRSWEKGEVPSSAPDQDLPESSTSKRPPRSTAQVAKAKPAGRTTVKRKSSTKSKKQMVSDDEDSPLTPDSDQDDDQRTEPAEDEEQDDFQLPGPSSRKRKRGAVVNKPAKKVNSKTAAKIEKQPSITPSTRQTKRLRSAVSASGSSGRDATRVFALWKQDGHYYPGTVHSQETGSRYLVKFDDNTESVVTLDQMRRCELQVGDDVLIPQFPRGIKVVDVSKVESNAISVRLEDEIKEFPFQAIKIATKTITYAWKDRKLSPNSITTAVRSDKVKLSPTPSGFSLASGSSVRETRSRILGKTGLAVTIISGNDNGRERGNVISAIKNHGGTIIDDWANIIRMEGKRSGNQWVIRKEDVQWAGNEDIERVFLLADDASQKPKFLIALALGIPCLSLSWLYDSVAAGEEKDWLGYMLPQGYSEVLGARPSQQVDTDWGNTIHHLNRIMDNSVACKLFDNLSVLCVGSDMVPLVKSKRSTTIDDKTLEAHNAVTRIILAMGADRVEAVSELRYASYSVADYDYVIIKESHQYCADMEEGRTVHWTWVKDCLIASRLLPLPSWGPQTAESQDA